MRIIIAMMWLVISCSATANVWHFDYGMRLRHQQVNDHWLADATATTLLARGEVQWQPNEELSVLAQYDQVWTQDKNRYNSVAYWNKRSPVPDVPGGELNQLTLNWQLAPNWQAIIGRQHISFNNERHIGSAAYWQNDQSFDAISLRFRDGMAWDVQYSYINKVHRIFGDSSRLLLPASDYRYKYNAIRPAEQLGNHDHASHLVNVNYQLSPKLTLSAFSYLLDNQSLPSWSSDTLGIRLEGSQKPKQLKYSVNLEVAWQQAGNSNPLRYQTWYAATELGVQYRSHKWGFGYEYLGEDQGTGFNTSLATNHKFLGWADIFSRYNNTEGIKDLFASYEGRNGKLRWKLAAHSFTSISSDHDIGYEFDFELAWRYSRKLEYKLLVANYQAQDGLSAAPATGYDLSTWLLSVAYNL